MPVNKAHIRDRFLRRKAPDQLTHDLAEAVRNGELEYEASTGRYHLTPKGDKKLREASR